MHKEENPNYVQYRKNKYNIQSTNALGISQKRLGEIALKIKKSNVLALQLFDTGIYEARILCSKVYDPRDLKPALMNQWVRTFENWEICDSFCLWQFAKAPDATSIIQAWHNRDPEFEKRACFATMAGLTKSDKYAENSTFESFFPLVEKASSDDRIYVKKAVDWALRSIGKRNKDLNNEALCLAAKLQTGNEKSAQWIGKKALKELSQKQLRFGDYPRNIYRKE